MATPIDFASVLPAYDKLPNKVKFLREQVLGYKRTEFIAELKRVVAPKSTSDETLKNLEQLGKGSVTTIARVLETLNELLKKAGYATVDRETLMAPFPERPAMKDSTKP